MVMCFCQFYWRCFLSACRLVDASMSAIKKRREAMHEWFSNIRIHGADDDGWFDLFSLPLFCWLPLILESYLERLYDEREMCLMTWFTVDFAESFMFSDGVWQIIWYSECIWLLLIASSVVFRAFRWQKFSQRSMMLIFEWISFCGGGKSKKRWLTWLFAGIFMDGCVTDPCWQFTYRVFFKIKSTPVGIHNFHDKIQFSRNFHWISL